MNEFIDLLLPWRWGEINWITDSFISVIVLTFIIASLAMLVLLENRSSDVIG